MKLTIIILLAWVGIAQAGDAELTWDASKDGTETSYNVYQNGVALGNTTSRSFTMPIPNDGKGYYGITAVRDGVESQPVLLPYVNADGQNAYTPIKPPTGFKAKGYKFAPRQW